MSELRFGILGCGNISKTHVQGITSSEGAVLTAVCDVIEDFLVPRVRHDSDPLVRHAIRKLRRNPGQPIAQLARVLEISERQFERRFLRHAGATPKLSAQTLRLHV